MAPAASGGPDGRTGQLRHQPGQPVAGEHGGPQQDEDVGTRRNPEATEGQHPVIQQAIEAAIESERQVDREREANGVDDPRRDRAAARARQSTEGVPRSPERDGARSGERLRPSIEQAVGGCGGEVAGLCTVSDSSPAGRSPTSLRLRMYGTE